MGNPKLPPDYGIKRSFAGSWYWEWYALPPSGGHTTAATEEEAVEACRRHRNRIIADYLREFMAEIKRENPDATAVWLDAIEDRARELDHEGEP